ncbi:hypothetical protein GLOIN_2v1768804 [Rhizophagus clarus]|uniref:Uncharacterized protein n=1 Tax=Rhizophagus clarus TaxID=94130 RepID=A0A8H3KS93_9GLOM|nr:hypothetical protein GLOIN_2v1768804 [Rhizophagus clarus]
MPPIQTSKLKQHCSAISNDVKRQICEWEKTNQGKQSKWEIITNTEESTQTFRNKEVKFPILENTMNL